MKGQNNFDKYRIKRLSRESIEAEEIFLDSKKLKESTDAEREKLETPLKKRRIYFLYFLIIFLLLILFVKVINLQIIKGNYWRSLADENRIRSYPIQALRGIIYDRNGKQFVFNKPGFNLSVIPADLLKQEAMPKILDYLAEILKEPQQNIKASLERIANLSIPVTIKQNISKEMALMLEAKFSNNPAVRIEVASHREYINGTYFFHLLGYLGKISPEERQKKSNYLPNDWIGKNGLELYYEDLLRGQYGRKLIEVDFSGEIKNIFNYTKPQAGKDIFLSVDSDLQKKLHDEIQQMLWGLKTNRAAGVALNPNTGEILALVSFPNLNSNKFIEGFSKNEFDNILKDFSKPLFNRVISGTYPPGSTIKPLIGAAAVKEGLVTPYQNINCLGNISVRHKYYPNIFSTFHDWKTHGVTNLIKAIAESCNVYFYTIGGGYKAIEGLGVEKISQYLRKFGLGKLSGLDLPGEIAGLIPDADWKKKAKNENWYIGDTYNISIGQGDIMITPLQIALATAVLANNGTLYKPYIVNKIGQQSISSQVLEKNIINDSLIFQAVTKGMRQAVISGSAKALYDLPVKVAGKTGTAQSPQGASHAWFTSFAPYENPEIVLTILIENGGEGSAVAVPIAKEVLKWYFGQ